MRSPYLFKRMSSWVSGNSSRRDKTSEKPFVRRNGVLGTYSSSVKVSTQISCFLKNVGVKGKGKGEKTNDVIRDFLFPSPVEWMVPKCRIGN